MICPDTDYDCDNPGCRHGGCQGRRPTLPLLRTLTEASVTNSRPGVEHRVLRDGALAALRPDANA